MKKKIKIVFFILLAVCLCPFIKVNAEEIVNYNITVKELSNNKVQMDFNVLNFKKVFGSQMYIQFNSSALEAMETLKGNVIVDGDSNVKLIFNRIDNNMGKVSYSITKVGQNTTDINEGILFSVIFNKKSNGSYDFSVENKSLFSDKEGNEITFKEFGDNTNNDTDIKIEYLSPIQQFKVKGTAKMIVRATNQTDVEKEVTLIVALFDSFNNFENYVAVKQVVAPGKSIEIEGSMKLTTQGKIKCFVWDSIQNMNPLSDALIFDVTP